jgi:hypothetical protein
MSDECSFRFRVLLLRPLCVHFECELTLAFETTLLEKSPIERAHLKAEFFFYPSSYTITENQHVLFGVVLCEVFGYGVD